MAVLTMLSAFPAATRQAGPRDVSDLVSLVPERLRPVATRFLDRSLPDEIRLDLLEEITDATPATSAFLARALVGEPSADVRAMLIGAMDLDTSAEAAVAVGEHARTDASAEVREIAIAKLRWEQVAALRRGARALRDVAAASRAAGTPASGLEAEASKREAVSLSTLGLPPPPPAFSATTASPVRVVVLGDFGTTSHGAQDSQERVADRMVAFHAITPFNLGITVGDNFYQTGLKKTTDPRWTADWEAPYARLGFPFYVVAGNHDWDGTLKAITAELAYTAVSPSTSWRMPATYFTFTAGPIQFFALDTDEMYKGVKDEQLTWLETEAGKSQAPWRIAYGHHPVLSGGEGHGAAQIGGEDEEIRILREKVLLPVLRKTTHLYVAGHDHELQLLDLQGIAQVVAGGGGRNADGVMKLPESLYCAQSFGFAVLEASDDELTVRFARLGDQPGSYAYSCTFTRDATGAIAHSCQTTCPD